MKKLALLCLLVPALAFAQDKKPEDYYREGEKQYNLGNFDAAVEAFKKGYELEADPTKQAAYIFNVAQSYRQAKNCERSVFFYKRYLALKANDPKRPLPPAKKTEIEGWISEGEVCMAQQAALQAKQPDGPAKPENDPNTTPTTTTQPDPNPQVAVVTPPDPGTDGGGIVTGPDEPAEAPILSARLVLGGSLVSVSENMKAIPDGNGNRDIDIPATFAGALIGGYPLQVAPNVSIDLGLGFSYSFITYKKMGADERAGLTGVFANVAPTYWVTPQIGVRADVGGGLLILSNVDMSTFTGGGRATSALSQPFFRGGLSADYAITPNVIATVSPITFTYASAKDGLAFDSLTGITFGAGIGYRM